MPQRPSPNRRVEYGLPPLRGREHGRPSPFQPANGGGFDAFVAKLNFAGSALVYSTYLGGTGDERGSGVAVDSAGNAYVTGYTSSTNFPTASPLQPANGDGTCPNGLTGGCDAFVAKISAPPLTPTLSKAFAAASIPLAAATDLTFTITNPDTSTTLTGIGFFDSLPAGLVVVGASNGCGGTATAVYDRLFTIGSV